MTATTFVTVKWGTKYTVDYVNILFDMVRRNLPAHFNFSFVCFTDDANGIAPGIGTRPLPSGLTGWWNKLYLFKQGVFEKDVRIVFFDLDTVITGDLSIFAAYDGDFAILRDFYRPDGWQSALMLWRGGFGADIWQSFDDAGRPEINGGDQTWIEKCEPPADILQDLFPGAIASFKEKARIVLPPGVRIVCFHGTPRPHEVKNGWVENVWKIGGTAPASNTAGDVTQPIENVRHALTLPLPWFDTAMPTDAARAVCIVGGGPSAKILLGELKQHRRDGRAIWALNGAFRWLTEQGTEPDAHVMSSPRAALAQYVPDRTRAMLFYASQCHPDILAKAARPPNRVILWHSLIDGIRTLLAPRNAVVISGGGTTGTKSIALARMQGFGRIHLYGFDSSFPSDPPASALDDENRPIKIEIDNLLFHSTPRLAQQVNDYRLMRQAMAPKGVVISVHGEGLLPYVAQKLAKLNAL